MSTMSRSVKNFRRMMAAIKRGPIYCRTRGGIRIARPGRPTGKRLMVRAMRVAWMRREFRGIAKTLYLLTDAARKRIMEKVLNFRRSRLFSDF